MKKMQSNVSGRDQTELLRKGRGMINSERAKRFMSTGNSGRGIESGGTR